MLIILLIFAIASVVGTFVGIYHDNGGFCDDDRFGWVIGSVFALVTTLGIIVAMIVLGGSLATEKALDQKIQMHEDENARIELVIKMEVQNYMEHEHDTYIQISDEDVEVLVIRYPELRSNELVQQQITLLQENNKTIRELKTQKINLIVYRWWLYFGY